MKFKKIRGAEDIVSLVRQTGFLPFFAGGVPGLSVEENCPPDLWFADDADGPWEWKGPAARGGRCVYGKFFRGRAGFVSREWLPDFCNWRRLGYDFDARWDDGLAPYKDKELYDAIASRGPLTTKRLKSLCGFRKGGKGGFETAVTRLQTQTYVVIADFVYRTDRRGRPYGWGEALYSTPEALFGREEVTSAYARTPEESRRRVVSFLKDALPGADEGAIARLIG